MIAVVGISLLLAVVMVISYGNLFAVAGLIGIFAVVAFTVYSIDWGFSIFIFFVFLFDQFDIPGFPTVTSQLGYFTNLSTIEYLPRMNGAAVTPMELHLLFIFGVWTLLHILRKGLRLAPPMQKAALVTYVIMIVIWLLRGQFRGGDFIIALWEVRGLFYLAMMIFLTPQLIRSRDQLRNLLFVCIAGITVKALQGAFRYGSLGFTFGNWPQIYETLTNHEDPVFIITLLILLIGLLLFGAKVKERTILLYLLPVLLLGFIAAQRRATYASFAATLIAFVILLPGRERWRLMKVFLVVAVFFGAYLGAFWNSSSRLAYPAQQIKSTFTNEAGVRGEKDVLSAFYRDQENYNLAYTFRSNPVVGLGFGMPFETPVHLWTININKLGIYIPHNQVFWIFIKMGAVGAFLFWFFFNGYLFRSAMIFARLTDPYLKAICAVCVVAVINQFVVSYVDMQLTFSRNMVYLGMLMGIPTVLVNIAANEAGAKANERHNDHMEN